MFYKLSQECGKSKQAVGKCVFKIIYSKGKVSCPDYDTVMNFKAVVHI